jgi:mucin-19
MVNKNMANMLETSGTSYSPAQRAVSLSIGVAFGLPLTSVAAMANGSAMPMPTTNHWVGHSAPSSSTPQGATSTAAFHSNLATSTTLVHTTAAPTLVHNHTSLTQNLLSNGVLNLSSAKLSFLAGNLANFQSLTIDVGGHAKTIDLNTKLTAAEVVAAEQVLSGAGQSIKIGANGVADGGKVLLNNSLLTAINNSIGAPLNSLTVARGVQVVDNLSSLSLSGSLTNYGSILTASGVSGAADTISAGTVLNSRSASIGSYAGDSSLFGADLNLNAASSLTNNGSISSAGVLNISAPALYNVSTGGANASIHAGGNVNLNTATLTNSGSIASTSGNVNVASNGALTVNGAGGTVQAANGNVNFTANNADINVLNGNVYSQQVNLLAGGGNVNATFDDVSGVVNTSGNNVHVSASTADLKLGTTDASGDPLFVNTAGNIDLTGSVAVGGQAYTAIASGNINTSANTSINTSSTTANGGAVTLIAGAVVSQPGGAGTTATVTKGSTTGGTIDLVNNGGVTTINSSTSFAGAQGGNVQLIAFAGSAAGSGTVLANNTTINTSATGASGTAGNVTIIAGAKTGNAIQTGAITATGVTGGGLVTVDTATPAITVTTKGTTGVVFDGSGNQTTNIFSATKTPNAASLVLGNVNATGGLNISTGANATVANTTSALNLGNVAVGKTGTLAASDSAGAITVNGTLTGGTANLTTTGANAINTSGAGTINTTTLNLASGTATDTITTNVANLALNTSGNVVDTQTALTMGVTGTVAGGSALSVTSGGQINVGNLSIKGGTLTLSTTAADKGGVAFLASVPTGTVGTITVNNGGKGVVSEAKGVTVAADKITLNTTTNVGTKAAPFLTNTGSNLTVNNTGAKAATYISDSSFGNVTFNGTGGANGSLFLTTNATTLTLNSASYATLSVTDASAKGTISYTGANDIGNGAGIVTLSAPGGISEVAKATGVILGTTVNLTASGTGSNVGISAANPILVSSAIVNGNAPQGSVYISDNLAATVNGSASIAGGTFSFVDSGPANAKTGNSLTVGKAITGGDIELSTVASASAGNILVTGTVGTSATNIVNINSINGLTTKGTILGNNITLGSTGGPVSIGGKVGDSQTILNIASGSPAGITITSPLTGHGITLTATKGPITTKAAINGTGPNSFVTLNGTSSTATGNAVVVGAAITGTTINLGYADNKTGQGNIAVNSTIGNASTNVVNIVSSSAAGAGGSITGTGLITGTGVTLTAANSIGTSAAPVNTAAGTLSANQSSTVAGAGAFINQKGNVNLGNSVDNSLQIKTTGAIDVTGKVVALNYNLSATTNFSIDGTLENTTSLNSTSGTSVINAGGNFNISKGGLLAATNGSTPVTVNVTGVATIDGTTKTNSLVLNSKGGFNLSPSALLNDNMDTITTTGAVTLAGQVGTADRPNNFGLTTTGAFTLAPGVTFIGGAKVTAASITNNTNIDGNGTVSLTATGAGNAIINNGNITGINIVLTTTNAGGVIFNAPGSTIIASQKALQTAAPTVSLNTYNVNNQGFIQAVGLVQGLQGTLNITSPGALTISGPDGSFGMNYFSAVNLKAGGNIVVGNASSNPFSNFDSAHLLGNFSVTTPGTFTSPMTGVSVVTNTTGTFGGTIAITASNVLYNGDPTKAQAQFALSATGAGPTISTGKAPITLNITGAQGLSVGGSGRYTVNAEGYGNTSLSTFSTPGVLSLDTSSNFDVHYTSLALTGNSRVFINGNLDEGSTPTTTITITTLSTGAFLIGGAQPTGLGQGGLSTGQGITAGVVTINAPGSVVVGYAPSNGVGAVNTVINGTSSVNLNTTALTVNSVGGVGSDISGLALNVNLPSTATAGNLTYKNLAPNGFISASAINLTDTLGSVVLDSGSGAGRTILGVGTNPNGPALSGVQSSGGAFNINAQGLKFSTGGVTFNASGGIDGGSVVINLTGVAGATSNPTITIGKGAGQISADVSDQAAAIEPIGVGVFRLSNYGNIVVDGLNTTQSLSSINLGSHGGILGFVANSNGLNPAGSTVSVDGTNMNGLSVNLFQITSTSTSPLILQGAAVGGNGISGKTATNIQGGNLTFENFGAKVVTAGATIEGTTLNLRSDTEIDATGNSSFTAFRELTFAGTSGGTINISTPILTVNKNGLALVAQGGQLAGGTINVTTTKNPIVVAQTITNGGKVANAVSFDVGDMKQGFSNPNFLAGTVNITSPGALSVNGNGIVFNDPSKGTPNGVGGQLTLNGGPGGNISFSNAAALLGLNFSTITFNSLSNSVFNLSNAAATGNGIVGKDLTSILTAGTIVVNNQTAGINATGAAFTTYSLALTAPSVSFGANQVITLNADDFLVGVTGPLGTTPPTGNGGKFTVTTPVLTFAPGGGVSIIAQGESSKTLLPGSTGGAIAINYTGTAPLKINSSTFAAFDVSNAIMPEAPTPPGFLQTAGTVSISSTTANLIITAQGSAAPFAGGTLFTYGGTGGSFTASAPNVSFTNIAALSSPSQSNPSNQVPPNPSGVPLGLEKITINTNSTNAFTVGGATGSIVNGITDASPSLIAGAVTFTNSFTPGANGIGGGINMTNGTGINANALTLTTPAAVTFAAGGIYAASQTVDSNANKTGGGVGGSFTVNAGSIAFSGTSANATQFVAEGNTANGAGGSITFTVSGKNTLNIGTGAGDLSFDVKNNGAGTGATAGKVSITNGGLINADLSGFTYGPFQKTGSGSLALSGTNLLVTNATALNASNLASMTFTSNSASDFVFGGATVNGFADAGATTLQAMSVTINANTGGIPGLTGGIATTDTSATALTTVLANNLTLTTPNTITLGSGTGLTVAADSTSGAGGTMTLSAGTYALSGPTAATLTAKGALNSAGGTITLTQKGLNTLNLNSVDGIAFNVQGGPTAISAGNVTVVNAGNLNVNGNAFTFGPEPPATNVGSGTLVLTGANVLLSNIAPLSVNPLQSLTINSSSNTDFSFNGAALNGIADTGASLTAATFILNANSTGTLYGGIDATALTNGTFTLNATNITLNTLNALTFSYGGTAITAVPTIPGGTGGKISLTAGRIDISGTPAGSVTLNANAGAGGSGGSVTITDAGTQDLVIGNKGFAISVLNVGVLQGGTVSVTNGGGIIADGNAISFGAAFGASAGPSLTLNANGILSLDHASNVDKGNQTTFNLSSDSAQAFKLGGQAVGSNGITDVGFDLQASTLGIANQGGAIELGSALGLNSAASMKLAAATDIGKLAPIVLDGTVANQSVTVTAGGDANFTVSDTASTSFSNGTVIGSLHITSTAAAGALDVGYASGAPGNLSAKDINVVFLNPSTDAKVNKLTLGNIAAFDGDLTINSTAEQIFIAKQTTITAYYGNINIFNTNADAGANITFEAGKLNPPATPGGQPTITPGAHLTATGPGPLTTQGNVTIAMTAVPYTPVNGITPNGTIVESGGGNVQFGAQTTNPNGSITVADDTVQLQGLGRELSFNTDTHSSAAINIGLYVHITADPPGSPIYTTAGVQAAASNNLAAAAAIANSVGLSHTVTPSQNTAIVGSGSTQSVSASTMLPNGSQPAAASTVNGISLLNGNALTSTGSLAAISNLNAGALTVANENGNENGTGISALQSGRAGVATSQANPRKLTGEVSNTSTVSRRTMERGSLLLSPVQNETVDTPYGSVTVAANSVALIISSDNGLAVYNLHDTHKGAVAIHTATSNITLAPGRSAVITASAKSFEAVNPAPFIGYRRVSGHDASGQAAKIYQADFEILSALRGLPGVKDMMKAEDAKSRAAMSSMLKTAAILNQLSGSGSSEPYALYLTPELTAYAASAH